MADLRLSKMDAARRQLETAIRLYFNWGDAVSIHTLAAAARNVLVNLCEHRDLKHPILFENLLNEAISPEHHQEVRNKFRAPENFFKHADRDPEEILEFNPEASEYWLLEAVEAYTLLTQEHVPVLHAYRGWWLLHHRNLLTNAPEQMLKGLALLRYEKHQRTDYLADV